MRKGRKLSRLAIVAASTLSLTFAGVCFTTTTASAACSNQPGDSLYLYKNRNSTGDLLLATASDSNLGTSSIDNFNDKASRAFNSYNCNAWVLYDDTNYRDRNYCIKPGQNIDLHDSRWNFGDKTSSIKKLNTTSCSGYPTFG
jgi:hypothetical protein